MSEQLNRLSISQPPQIYVGEVNIQASVKIKMPVLSPIGEDELKSNPISNGIPAVTVKTSVILDPEEQAFLLQDTSKQLTSHAKENKIAFNEEYTILKKLAEGVSYANLNENEKAILGRLGLNNNNIDKTFASDLLTLVKPYINATRTVAFDNIMDKSNKVVDVIKKEDQKVDKIAKEAEDLNKFQSLTKTLGASKVSKIIEEQSNAFYNKIPAKLTPDAKVVLSDPMDIVTRGLIIDSVKSPDNFNLVKDALSKIKDGKIISNQENTALNRKPKRFLTRRFL